MSFTSQLPLNISNQIPTWLQEFFYDVQDLMWNSDLFGHSPSVLAAQHLAMALNEGNQNVAVDLYSKGGKAVETVYNTVVGLGNQHFHVILTNEQPNVNQFHELAHRAPGIKYIKHPVNPFSCNFEGLRMMLSGLRYMSPADTSAWMATCVSYRNPIALFELSRNSVWTALFMSLLFPLFAVLGIPFMKLCFRRILFTFFIPLIPILAWYEGLTSCLLAYKKSQLIEIVKQADPEHQFKWRIGEIRLSFYLPIYMTTLIGVPNADVQQYGPYSPRRSPRGSVPRQHRLTQTSGSQVQYA